MTIAADIGQRPISESQPAGSEARDSAEFERVQDEIAKLSSLSGDSIVNWAELIAPCETILTRQSKDLLIACYLAGSLLETEGPAGLAGGLGVVADLLQTYWETLFPPLKRLRARRNALQWLIERIDQKAATTAWQEQPIDGDVLDAILDRLRAIDSTLQQKDDEAPSLRPLLATLGELPRAAPVNAEPAPATASAAPSAPPERAAAAPAPTAVSAAATPAAAPLDGALAAEQAAALLGQRVCELAGWYQGIDLANPASYRLGRIALWSAIDALPAQRDGRTHIPAPQAQTVDILKRLEAGGGVAEIVRFCENQLGIHPFWLDLNRVAGAALALGGAPLAAARAALEEETARFVDRLPGLRELNFSNGQPFADPATLNWLGGLRGAAGAPERGAATDEAASVAVGEARALAAAGQQQAAATRIQQEIAGAGSAQKRFALRLQLYALLAAQDAQPRLAPFARILLADLDRFNLAEWDPPLALSGLRLAYRLLAADPNGSGEAAATLTRLAALDPAAALELLT